MQCFCTIQRAPDRIIINHDDCVIVKYVHEYSSDRITIYGNTVMSTLKGPLNYKYILTYVHVHESIHHTIITC